MSHKRINIFGFDFIIAATVEQVVDDIMADAGRPPSGRVRFLITPNAAVITAYAQTGFSNLKQFYKKADYVLPDGMPIVWLSRLKRRPSLPARITGSDLFPALWKAIRKESFPVTMVLPDEDLSQRFRNEYSFCNVIVPHMFKADDDDYISHLAQETATRIMENRSRFLFIGISFPKQEKLGMAITEELSKLNYEQNVLILLLGASFEFYFGLKKRAPLLFRKTGFEWLFRLLQEPRRLGKRYTVDNIRFLALAIKELIKPSE